MLDLQPLLAHANLVFNDRTEDNIETFLQYLSGLEEPTDVLESAILEVVADLTMHEYLCDAHEVQDA